MAERLLEVASIETRYGLSQVLFGMSLAISAGEMVTLMGRNGMGKTTTVRSIMGLTPATAGSIRFDGHEIGALPSFRVAQLGIGLVPEGRQIFPNLTTRENLVATASNRAVAADPWTLDKVCELFPRLGERLNSMGNLLSGGEQQMLAVGRALMTNPRLLILDEATEGLAPLVVAEIWRTVAEIRATGIATLIVDRNARAVLAHTDDAVVLEKGRVVLAGASRRLADDGAALERYLGV
jgi:branched-chain amino acid transport system ATP-binding protein